MMRWLQDPDAFTHVIMVLYLLSSARYFLARDVAHGCYWLCALGITATVTFLMEGKG